MSHTPSHTLPASAASHGTSHTTTQRNTSTVDNEVDGRSPTTTITSPQHQQTSTHAPHDHCAAVTEAPSSIPPSSTTNGSSVLEQHPEPANDESTTTSNSAKSRATTQTTGTTGLSQSPTFPRTSNNSSTIGASWSASFSLLVPTSSHMTSAHQIEHPDTLMVDPSCPGHLTESSPVAVVAPATVTSTQQPISSNPAPIPIQPASFASAQHHQHNQHPLDAVDIEGKQQEKSQVVAAAASSSSSSQPSSADIEALKQLMQEGFAAALKEATQQQQQQQQQLLQMHQQQHQSQQCHCLVVDQSLIIVGSPHESDLKKAMALERNQSALEEHVRTWLQPHVPSSNIDCIYITSNGSSRQLHCNFIGLGELGAAQVALPFLVRCGVVNASKWNKVCGDLAKNKVPEMIHFSCIPLVPQSHLQLESDARAFLATHGVECTVVWCPPRRYDATPEQQRRGQTAPINFYALPRRLDNLSTIIEQLHQKVEFWGGQVRVDCPNTPSLARCNHCLKLGHPTNKCELYCGLAFRLLMKEPVSYAIVKQLLSLTSSARTAYLGSSVDERAPSRRVTILFDATKASDQEMRAGLVSSLMIALTNLNLCMRLHAPPTMVDPKHRTRECRECGSMEASAHVCPFVFAGPTTKQITSATANPPAAGQSRLSAVSEDVCREWGRSKVCKRLADHLKCRYKHPPDTVPTGNPCHQYQREGKCSRGMCKFEHIHGPPPVAQPAAPVVAAPVVAAPVVQVAVQQPSDSPAAVVATVEKPAAAAVAQPPPSQPAPTPPAAPDAPVTVPSTVTVSQPLSTAQLPAAAQPVSGTTKKRTRREEPPDTAAHQQEESKESDAQPDPDEPSSRAAKKHKQGSSASFSTTTSSNRFEALGTGTSENDEDADMDSSSTPTIASSPSRARQPRQAQAASPARTQSSTVPSASMSSLSALTSPHKERANPRGRPSGPSTKKKASAAKQPAAAAASSNRPAEDGTDEDMEQQ
jgi:hypothetical protein